MQIRPIKISWSPRWDKGDKLFYIGKSWEASLWTLNKTCRLELYSIRIQLGPVRIMLGTLPNNLFWSQNYEPQTTA